MFVSWFRAFVAYFPRAKKGRASEEARPDHADLKVGNYS
jgi:hypothetical protein